MANIYQSIPLSPERRTIRLLQVHSAGDNDLSKAVVCDLSVLDLDVDHPPFATLTYVWNIDAVEERATVSCGGQVLSLTRNGYDALRHLRKRLGTFTIWIDALCIDQANHDEKMNQVRLMGDIYSKAQTVYVWLGSGNVACRRALNFVKRAGFQHSFPRDLESASYEIHQLEAHEAETRKAAFDYAFGRMGRIQVSSSPGTSKSAMQAAIDLRTNKCKSRSPLPV